MKSKYLAIVLVVLMVIGLVACGQQAQVTEEPSQEVQQTEPAVQPTEANVSAAPIETEPQETTKPVESKEPVEVAENDPEEVVESGSVEATPEPEQTPVPTVAPTQKPTATKPQESAPVQTSSAESGTDGGLTASEEETGTEDYGLEAMLQYAAEHQGSGTGADREGAVVGEYGIIENPNVAVSMN